VNIDDEFEQDEYEDNFFKISNQDIYKKDTKRMSPMYGKMSMTIIGGR